MPAEVQEAFMGLISMGLPFLMVYYAPANRHTVAAPDSPAGEAGLSVAS